MEAWPKPMAWKKTIIDRSWKPFRPPGGIFKIEPVSEEMQANESRSAQAYRLFYETIPKRVTQTISPVYERHWHLLALAARCPGAVDLIENNPALSFALASNWVFRRPVQKPIRAAKSLVRRKQREILSWLNFPGTESTVRVFRKIPPSQITIKMLLNLQTCMRADDSLKILAHLPKINAYAAFIIADPFLRRSITYKFLEEIALDKVTNAGRLEYLLTLTDIRGIAGKSISGLNTKIDSLEKLNAIHQELIEAIDGVKEVIPTYEFPVPPISGTPDIIPLIAPRALYDEGKEQGNCVASYAERIARGKVFVYRMVAPERATLSLILSRRKWILDEIKAANNSAVRPETVDFVVEWLNKTTE